MKSASLPEIRMRQSTRYLFMSGVALAALLLAGCADTVTRLQQVGKQPPYTPLSDPTRKADYEPLTVPLPESAPPQPKYVNSLWQPGARAFFRDQRAARVGDILRVAVRINDQIQSQNSSQGQRQSADVSNFPSLAGVQKKTAHILSGGGNPSSFINTSGDRNTKSTGNITRLDQIQTEVSALITQVLPNGNFVIDGSQEILMNYEI